MLALRRAIELPVRPEEFRWLIEGLWADEAVGICGGEPKCCKSFLALDMAVAVASGSPCLRTFRVMRPGPVLLFAGEDSLPEVRRRLVGIAEAAGVDLATLDIYVITVPVLRLDRADHRDDLAKTVAAIKPRLLVLDPFVRMHRIDENQSQEVAPLLAYLRELQREHHTSVVLVHHARKGAAHARAGQALRGSSEFHAWGDSNLYLRRKEPQLLLTIEHRTAASTSGIRLELVKRGEEVSLGIVEPANVEPQVSTSPTERIVEVLRRADKPMRLVDLRHQCRIRTRTVCESLGTLIQQGRVRKGPAGYEAILGSAAAPPVSSSPP